MTDRVSQTILLCEDATHERLTKAYLRACGLPTGAPQVRTIVASRMKHGRNIGWVLGAIPEQLRACRKRSKRAKSLLIVLVDADDRTVDERRSEIDKQLEEADCAPLATDDPAVLLIPKRNIETWIQCARGRNVDEETDYKTSKKLDKAVFNEAAGTIHGWALKSPEPGPTCVPSLRGALPNWRRIG